MESRIQIAIINLKYLKSKNMSSKLFSRNKINFNSVIFSNDNLKSEKLVSSMLSDVELNNVWVIDGVRDERTKRFNDLNLNSFDGPSIEVGSVTENSISTLNRLRDSYYSDQNLMYTDIELEISINSTKDSKRMYFDFNLYNKNWQENEIILAIDAFCLKIISESEKSLSFINCIVIREDINNHKFSEIILNRINELFRICRKYNCGAIFITNNLNLNINNRYLVGNSSLVSLIDCTFNELAEISILAGNKDVLKINNRANSKELVCSQIETLIDGSVSILEL